MKLFTLRKGAYVEFECLIVLALDLQLCLQFLDQQFEPNDFRT